MPRLSVIPAVRERLERCLEEREALFLAQTEGIRQSFLSLARWEGRHHPYRKL